MFGLSRRIWLCGCLFLGGCLYGFAGGGLPGHVRTVAILPFDNQTAEPALTREVTDAVQEALESRLGLRLAGEESANATVRGTIFAYDSDIPLSFRSGQPGVVEVTRRKIQIALSVEIYDNVEERVLWERSRITIDGEYEPPQETAGRERALEKLVADIVDGAQSQW